MSNSDTRNASSTDLTNEQWAIIEPIISQDPNQTGAGRPREVSLREVINAILYLNRTGCQWDLLPHDLPAKSTVYDYSRSGAMTAPGTISSPPFAHVFECRKVAKPLRVRHASTRDWKKQRRSAGTNGVTTEARKSKAESVICSSIHWDF